MPSAMSNVGLSEGIWSSHPLGRRGGDQLVVGPARVDLLAQRDHLREIDVVPTDVGSGVDAEHTAVQPAAEVDDGALGVRGDELAHPDVVLRGANGEQRSPLRGDLEFTPVEVELADRLLGEPVAEDGLLEVRIERLEVQRGQHRLRGTAQIDRNFVVHVCEAMRLRPGVARRGVRTRDDIRERMCRG